MIPVHPCGCCIGSPSVPEDGRIAFGLQNISVAQHFSFQASETDLLTVAQQHDTSRLIADVHGQCTQLSIAH